ncbi:MAG: hypothetical protein H0X59_05015, partial [Chloroflexi bacterium]|nr:hypothetical protein [Chloroflexota bacterium]
MLQNARDAWNTTHADATHGVVLVRLTSEPALIIANQGEALRPEALLDSISKFGESTKEFGAAIGHKGIGFKAVLEISLTPEIYSLAATDGPFDLRARFDPRHARDLIHEMTPDWSALVSELASAEAGADPDERIPVLRFPAWVEQPGSWLDTPRGGASTPSTPSSSSRSTLCMRRPWAWTMRASSNGADLLAPAERRLFARLGVFAGGAALEEIEAVCGSGATPVGMDVLDGLTSLADKSLLNTTEDEHGEPRFGMLRTIREFAQERLAGSGEEAEIRDRHLAAFLHHVEEAEPHLLRAGRRRWLDRLEREHDNFRAALDWAVGRPDVPRALRLAGGLWRLWQIRGYLDEGRERIAAVLALPGV